LWVEEGGREGGREEGRKRGREGKMTEEKEEQVID